MNNIYFTDFGLLSDVVPIGIAENKSIWSVEYAFLKILLNDNKDITTNPLMTLYDGKRWYPDSDHSKMQDQGFSKDNMDAITAWGLYSKNELMRKAGIVNFDITRYFLPQDFCWYLYTYNPSVFTPCLMFVYAYMIYQMHSFSSTEDGKLDTDSKLRGFVKLQALRETWHGKLMWNLSSYILSRRMKTYLNKHPLEIPSWSIDNPNKASDNVWRTLFSMYFRDANNPINITASESF